jgi:NAD(P)-dependent dehydrogenase (short-subunit alcohol dehydrogenase family)
MSSATKKTGISVNAVLPGPTKTELLLSGKSD